MAIFTINLLAALLRFLCALHLVCTLYMVHMHMVRVQQQVFFPCMLSLLCFAFTVFPASTCTITFIQ
jgi:hypothetical protein